VNGNGEVLRPKIPENGPILTFWVPKSMYFFHARSIEMVFDHVGVQEGVQI